MFGKSLGLWLPILSDRAAGGLAGRVDGALDDIAESLAPGSFDPSLPWPGDLADGPAGAALFFHYLDQARPGRGYDDLALAHLEAAIDFTAEARSSPALYNGFTGIAWALEHLTGRLLEPPGPGEVDAGGEVAEALTGYLRDLPRYDGYDLFNGLAGLGVWALERWPRSGAAEVLERVVQGLGGQAERLSGGFAWLSPPERLSPAELAVYPRGCYRLGVAHGIAGVIGVLGAIGSAGLKMGAARELLAGAVEWLLAQRLPPDAVSRFPRMVAPGAVPTPAVPAWCRGDLGIAVALLTAARAAGEPEWERQALGTARAAVAWLRDAAEIPDGGLCHGAAGLAHLYNRLFQATGDPLFKREAIAWIERLLAQRQAGRGLAGWLCWRATREVAGLEVEFEWVPVPGLLTGVAGIGLALLAAVSPVEPAWDRVLLCAVPAVAEDASVDVHRARGLCHGYYTRGHSPGKEIQHEEEGDEEGPQAQRRDAL